MIGVNAALHDIGKVGIEDAILLKPGKLTADERRRMQEHTTIGERCLAEIERRLGACNFLQMARDIVLCHQERWDGSGYPNGLMKTRIPLAARIVAIADVYDALASRRVYKPALPHEECVAIIRAEAGKQFDPEMVETFLKVEKTFREINRRYGERLRPTIRFRARAPPPGAKRETAGLCHSRSLAPRIRLAITLVARPLELPLMHPNSAREQRVLEIMLSLICVALTCMLYMIHGYKMVILNLFFLPVVLAGFYLGRYRAGIMALFSVLCASVATILRLNDLMLALRRW